MFADINQVLAHRFVGNYHADRAAFAAIDLFVKLTPGRAEKIAALNHIETQGMGEAASVNEVNLDLVLSLMH